jgi:hypothetical protein
LTRSRLGGSVMSAWVPSQRRLADRPISRDAVLGCNRLPHLCVADIMALIRKGERVSHYETVRQRKDGTTFPVSVSVSPVNDDYGTTIGAASGSSPKATWLSLTPIGSSRSPLR